MKTFTYQRIIILSVLAASLLSCSEAAYPCPEGSDSRSVGFVLSLEVVRPQSLPGTKMTADTVDEGRSADYLVRDLWVMQYCGEQLVGTPLYVQNDILENETSVTLRVPRQDGIVYRCLVVANTHDPDLFNAGNVSTLSALKRMAKTVASKEDLLQIYPDGERHLLMNGEFDLDSSHDGGSMPRCRLYRSVARLTLQLHNASDSDLALQSVRLCNIQDHIYYTDGLFQGRSGFPPLTGRNILDLATTATQLPPGTSDTLVCYVPRNCRGDNGSQLEKDKNTRPPEGATFIEIMGQTRDGRQMRYRFYPGKDMVRNFDVIPGYNYVLPLVFNTAGNPGVDSRVEDLGEVLLSLQESNCYLLHPMTTRVMCIPITQINKFWRATSPAGQHPITPQTEWTAEVIWQDIDRQIVQFCDGNGQPVNGGGSFSGKGETCIFLKMNGIQAEGNVLIGLRRTDEQGVQGKDRKYLWSWHLWITAYDPDRRPASTPWLDGRYSYEVPGGKVYRYDDRTIGWNMDFSDPWKGKYLDRYIMDRELGAGSGASPALSSEDYRTWGLYYQYGRKDPFPRGAVERGYGNSGSALSPPVLYQIDGKTPPAFTRTGGDCIRVTEEVRDFLSAAQYPYVFYTGSGSGGDWASGNPYKAHPWNGINPGGKSILDPCPPGWKIADHGTFDVFALPDSYSANASCPTFAEDDGAGYDFYVNDVHTDGTDWYPASGYRNGLKGYMHCVRKEIWLWALQYENDIYNDHLPAPNFKSGFVMTQLDNKTPRNRGVPVRCVQE